MSEVGFAFPVIGADVVFVLRGFLPGDFLPEGEGGVARDGGVSDDDVSFEGGGFFEGFAVRCDEGDAEGVAVGVIGGVDGGVDGGGIEGGGVDIFTRPGSEGDFVVLKIFGLPRRAFELEEGEVEGVDAGHFELEDGSRRGADEEDGVDLEEGDGREVGEGEGEVAGGGRYDLSFFVGFPDADFGGCDFNEVDEGFVVFERDEDGGREGVSEVAHAAAAGDAACGEDVEVGEGGAGASVNVHIGAQSHLGRDFAAIECESFHCFIVC